MKFSSPIRKKSETIVVPTINKDLFEDEPVSMCLCVEKTSDNRIIRNSPQKLTQLRQRNQQNKMV